MFFFFLPVGMNYRTERLPIVTFSLIGLNTLIYLVSLIFSFDTQGASDLWIWPASLADPGGLALVIRASPRCSSMRAFFICLAT